MNGLKLFFTKNYWSYISSLKKITTDTLSVIGTIWLLIEVINFFSTSTSDLFKKYWVILALIGLIYVIVENWPRDKYCFKLKEKDISIQLSIGNLFSYPGDLIIPINTSFDTSFDNDLISLKSVQGQFTLNYFREPRFLDQDIAIALNGESPLLQIPNKIKGNKYRYEIGKVIKLKLSKWDKFAYLVASADMNEQGTSFTSFDNILTSLGSLWEFIRTKGECDSINIPIIGSGRGRILESRETIIKAIVHSFIASALLANRFCNKLNIVIHPKDYQEYKINLKELADFIKLKTIHY